MTLTTLLLVLHLAGAIWLAGGVVARQMTRAHARRAADLEVFLALDNLAGRFEGLLVQPGSLVTVASGLGLAILQGWPVLGFLQGAEANWLLAANLLILSVMLMIPLVFVPRGKAYQRLRDQAIAHGDFTPELRRALEDPGVRRAHIWEYVATAAVIFLMVAKPF